MHFFSPNIFSPRLVESTDAEPLDMKGWLCCLHSDHLAQPDWSVGQGLLSKVSQKNMHPKSCFTTSRAHKPGNEMWTPVKTPWDRATCGIHTPCVKVEVTGLPDTFRQVDTPKILRLVKNQAPVSSRPGLIPAWPLPRTVPLAGPLCLPFILCKMGEYRTQRLWWGLSGTKPSTVGV